MTDTEQDPMSGHRIARRLIRMVGALHDQGFESLYLYCGMNGSGSNWRYSIGAMDHARWPRLRGDPLHVFNSMNGSDDPGQIEWAALDDTPDVLSEKFMSNYPEIVDAARIPNPAYVTWFRQMLSISEPLGLLVFYFDYKTDPRPEFWGSHPDVFVDLPAGLLPEAWG